MQARLMRLTGWAPWVNCAGLVMLLVGLGWDAALHRIDPGLAQREGVFTLTNPGHALFAAGIGLLVVGALLFLLGRAQRHPGFSLRRRAAFVAPVVGLLALSGVSLGFAMSSPGGLTGHTHSHTGTATAAHADLAVQMADVPVTHDHAAADALAAASSPKGVIHGHGGEVPITTEQLEAAVKLWTDTKTGVARLQDLSVAQAEGYRQITPWVGRLAHFHNQGYFSAAHTLDTSRPEELIYAKMPGTQPPKLVGVMYLAQPGQAGPKVGGPLTSWHAHDNLCFTRDGTMVIALANAAGQCPAGTIYNGVTPEMLHVWLVDNPSGVFSEDMAPQALVQVLNASNP